MAEGNHPEQDWHPRMESSVPLQEPRERAFPVWIWGCGGGCLLLLVLFIGGSIWIGNWVTGKVGPEAAWPVIAELMPYGPEPPEGYQPMIFAADTLEGFLRSIPGMSDEQLADLDLPVEQQIYINRVEGAGIDTSLVGVIYVFPDGTTEERRDEILHQEATELTSGGQKTEPLREVELTFQGRTVTATRFAGINEFQRSFMEVDGPLQILEVDVSEGRERPVVLHLTGPNQPTEQDLQVFFEPFDVWRDQ